MSINFADLECVHKILPIALVGVYANIKILIVNIKPASGWLLNTEQNVLKNRTLAKVIKGGVSYRFPKIFQAKLNKNE